MYIYCTFFLFWNEYVEIKNNNNNKGEFENA